MESTVSFSVCEALCGATAGLAARISLRRPLTDGTRANRRAPLSGRGRGMMRATVNARSSTRSRARSRAARFPYVAERCGKKGPWRFLIVQTVRANVREVEVEREREKERRKRRDRCVETRHTATWPRGRRAEPAGSAYQRPPRNKSVLHGGVGAVVFTGRVRAN